MSPLGEPPRSRSGCRRARYLSAFSSRLMSTCSISTPSIGTSSSRPVELDRDLPASEGAPRPGSAQPRRPPPAAATPSSPRAPRTRGASCRAGCARGARAAAPPPAPSAVEIAASGRVERRARVAVVEQRPAAPVMVASGVRRSCETELRRALRSSSACARQPGALGLPREQGALQRERRLRGEGAEQLAPAQVEERPRSRAARTLRTPIGPEEPWSGRCIAPALGKRIGAGARGLAARTAHSATARSCSPATRSSAVPAAHGEAAVRRREGGRPRRASKTSRTWRAAAEAELVDPAQGGQLPAHRVERRGALLALARRSRRGPRMRAVRLADDEAPRTAA